jgi:hypothetical protein
MPLSSLRLLRDSKRFLEWSRLLRFHLRFLTSLVLRISKVRVYHGLEPSRHYPVAHSHPHLHPQICL